MEIMENYLTVETASGLMDLFVAAPAGVDKFPVVLVFQEAFGVNGHIKNICKRLAEEGYLAAAPELFHRESRHLTVDYSQRDAIKPLLSRLTNEELLEDAQRALQFLGELPNADTTQIFTMGFCMGGFTSLLCATRLPIKGAIAFYGAGVVRSRPGIGLKPFLNDFSRIQCPLLLFFGEQDVSITSRDRQEIEDCLRKEGKEFEIHVFEAADHGFFCDERKAFDQRAASEAWKQSMEWLRTHQYQSEKNHNNAVTSIHLP